MTGTRKERERKRDRERVTGIWRDKRREKQSGRHRVKKRERKRERQRQRERQRERTDRVGRTSKCVRKRIIGTMFLHVTGHSEQVTKTLRQ